MHLDIANPSHNYIYPRQVRHATGSLFMAYKCVIHATLIRPCSYKSGLAESAAIVRRLVIMPLTTIVIEK